jgi:hypothetical protein
MDSDLLMRSMWWDEIILKKGAKVKTCLAWEFLKRFTPNHT